MQQMDMATMKSTVEQLTVQVRELDHKMRSQVEEHEGRIMSLERIVELLLGRTARNGDING